MNRNAVQRVDFPMSPSPHWDLFVDVINIARQLAAEPLTVSVRIASETAQVSYGSVAAAKAAFNKLEARRGTWGAWSAPRVEWVVLQLTSASLELNGRVYIRPSRDGRASLIITSPVLATALLARTAIEARLRTPAVADDDRAAPREPAAPPWIRKHAAGLVVFVVTAVVGELGAHALGEPLTRIPSRVQERLDPVTRHIVTYGQSRYDDYFDYAPLRYRCDLSEIPVGAHFEAVEDGRRGCEVVFAVGTLRDEAQHPRGRIGVVYGDGLIEPTHRDGAFAHDLYPEDVDPMVSRLFFNLPPGIPLLVRVQSVARSPLFDFDFEQPESGHAPGTPSVALDHGGADPALPAKRTRWAAARTVATPA